MVPVIPDRKNAVCFNFGIISFLLGIKCGVPHGSVLRPLLLLLFINDLLNISEHLQFYFFADDANLYYDSEMFDDIIKKVNEGLKYIRSSFLRSALRPTIENLSDMGSASGGPGGYSPHRIVYNKELLFIQIMRLP